MKKETRLYVKTAVLIGLGIVWSLAELPSAMAAVDQSDSNIGWKLVKKEVGENGIQVYSRSIQGSEIHAFRGETIVDASIGRVSSVIIDPSRKREWVYKLTDVRTLEVINDLERIEYNRTATPIVMKDRETVFYGRAELQPEKNVVIFHVKSVDVPHAPKTPYVRAVVHKGAYILTALGPNKTKVVVEMHVDPMGSVAAWIINMFQVDWPYHTLEGLKRQVTKRNVGIIPEVRRLLSKLKSEKKKDGTLPYFLDQSTEIF